MSLMFRPITSVNKKIYFVYCKERAFSVYNRITNQQMGVHPMMMWSICGPSTYCKLQYMNCLSYAVTQGLLREFIFCTAFCNRKQPENHSTWSYEATRCLHIVCLLVVLPTAPFPFRWSFSLGTVIQSMIPVAAAVCFNDLPAFSSLGSVRDRKLPH